MRAKTTPSPPSPHGRDGVRAGTWSQNWADRREIMNDIANKTKQLVKDHPEIQCFLIECTEAFGFAEQIKFATGLPVYTGNTLCRNQTSRRPDSVSICAQAIRAPN